MRDPNRIDVILKEIEEVWKKNPDLRLGQLIEIIQFKSRSKADVFYIEDDVLLKGIQSLKNER